MFDGRWRDTVDRGTGPVGRRLQRFGVTADVLTATGLVSATATAVAVGTGHLHLAIVLLILTGLHDLLDGPVAKASGTSLGARRLLRLGDRPGGRRPDPRWRGLVPGVDPPRPPGRSCPSPCSAPPRWSPTSGPRRSRSGISAKGGLMERAERMILLGIGFLSPSFLVPVLWVMLALTMATAVGRFVKVWRLAEAPVPRGHAPRSRTGRARTAARAGAGARRRPSPSRWRARRQGELSSRSGRTWRARQARQGPGSAPVDATPESVRPPNHRGLRAREQGAGGLPDVHDAGALPRRAPRAGGPGPGQPGRRRAVPRAQRAPGDGLGQPAPGARCRRRTTTQAVVDRWARRSFRAYARYWVEGARLRAHPAGRGGGSARSSRASTTWPRAMAAGKGVIMALPHIGSWEYRRAPSWPPRTCR